MRNYTVTSSGHTFEVTATSSAKALVEAKKRYPSYNHFHIKTTTQNGQ